MGRQYYRQNSRRLTWAECLRITRNGGAPFFLCFIPKFGLLPAIVLPRIESFRELEVPRESIEPAALGAMSPFIAEAEACGFTELRFFKYGDLHKTIASAIAEFRHQSGVALLRVMFVRPANAASKLTKVAVAILTACEDGTWQVASNKLQDMDGPPNVRLTRRVGTTATALWAAHLEALARERPCHPIQLIRTREEAEAVAIRYEECGFSFNVARGVWVPLSDADLEVEMTAGCRGRN